jgi:replicative DNA helicase
MKADNGNRTAGNGTDRGWPGEISDRARRTVAPMVRGLPHSVEAEQGVLGSMLISPNCVPEAEDRLMPEAFYVPAHQTVFNYLVAAHGSVGIDLITFTQHLKDGGVLEEVGGVGFVTGLFTFVPTAANIGYYIEIVREKWVLRQIIADCTETARQCYEEQDEVDKLLSDHLGRAIQIGQNTSTVETLKHLKDFVPGAVKEIEDTFHNRGKPIGLASGFHDFDRMTSGFQAPLTYYFAARPAMGKSSVMTDISDNIAVTNAADGISVGIFSTEMTGHQLARRMLCARAELSIQRVRDGFMAKKETWFPELQAEAQRLIESHIWIEDRGSLSIHDFRLIARRMVVKRGVKLILIDYIQRMHSTSRRAQGNREQEMNEIAQGISATAKELNVPIVVLAQLNRNTEERPDKRPALSDLRESGSMEQEARVVVLLYRPSYYAGESEKLKRKMARDCGIEIPEDEDETGNPAAGWRDEFDRYAEFIVAKQNDGATGTIKMRFVKEFARFDNVTRKLFSNNPRERQGGDVDL